MGTWREPEAGRGPEPDPGWAELEDTGGLALVHGIGDDGERDQVRAEASSQTSSPWALSSTSRAKISITWAMGSVQP